MKNSFWILLSWISLIGTIGTSEITDGISANASYLCKASWRSLCFVATKNPSPSSKPFLGPPETSIKVIATLICFGRENCLYAGSIIKWELETYPIPSQLHLHKDPPIFRFCKKTALGWPGKYVVTGFPSKWGCFEKTSSRGFLLLACFVSLKLSTRIEKQMLNTWNIFPSSLPNSGLATVQYFSRQGAFK